MVGPGRHLSSLPVT